MELLTLREAAAELRMSPSMLKRHVVAGRIAFVVIGEGKSRQHIRFRRDDLETFLLQRRRVRDPPPAPAPQARIDDAMDRWVKAEMQRIFSRPLPKRRPPRRRHK